MATTKADHDSPRPRSSHPWRRWIAPGSELVIGTYDPRAWDELPDAGGVVRPDAYHEMAHARAAAAEQE